MQNGPFRLQTTCTQCGGSGKAVKVLNKIQNLKYLIASPCGSLTIYEG